MEPIILSQLKDGWIKKREELSKKRRPRRYLHFDRPISVISRKIANEITNPTKITTHPFFPLISSPQSARIYRRDPQSGTKKIEWKERPISYPSHYDSLVYSWYAFLLEFKYEQRLKDAGLSDSVIAYRKLDKSNVDFAADVFKYISKQDSCGTIALDVKGFYDNLDFAILKKSWKANLLVTNLPEDHYKVFKSITNFAYVRFREIAKLLKLNAKSYKKSTLFFDADILGLLRKNNKIKTNKTKGIPQGTPISCALSNIYMFDFDKAILERVNTYGGMYRRYSDDILIVCPTKYLDAMNEFAYSEIEKLKLEIQKSKTEIRHFNHTKGKLICQNEHNRPSKLQYLGIEFDGEKTLVRHKSYARFERRMKKAIVRKKIAAEKYKTPLFKKQIYEAFSPLGERNYTSYARGAYKKLEGLSPDSILRQVGTHRILRKINKKISGKR